MMGKTPQQLTNEEWEKIGVVLSNATFPNILTAEDAGAILKRCIIGLIKQISKRNAEHLISR